jgi:hypothetical protein
MIQDQRSVTDLSKIHTKNSDAREFRDTHVRRIRGFAERWEPLCCVDKYVGNKSCITI